MSSYLNILPSRRSRYKIGGFAGVCEAAEALVAGVYRLSLTSSQMTIGVRENPLNVVADADVYAPQAGTTSRSPTSSSGVGRSRNRTSRESQLGPANVDRYSGPVLALSSSKSQWSNRMPEKVP